MRTPLIKLSTVVLIGVLMLDFLFPFALGAAAAFLFDDLLDWMDSEEEEDDDDEDDWNYQ